MSGMNEHMYMGGPEIWEFIEQVREGMEEQYWPGVEYTVNFDPITYVTIEQWGKGQP